jgi:ubiquinone/menaquinone biosynthesis C-methylase UbiE
MPTDRAAASWQELARAAPYFAVLTDEQFLGSELSEEALREFFATGEADVDRLFRLIHGHCGDIAPKSVLDFGCGVGRLSLALARRAEHVTGIDVAPRMIELADSHAKEAGVQNVDYATVEVLEGLPPASVDLICSLIVFQHIPVKSGMQLLASLLRLLAPGGVVALHFTFRRSGGPLRRMARRLRTAVPLIHKLAQRLRREKHALPYMEMNEYDLQAVLRRLGEAGCGEPLIEPTDHGGIEGAIIVSRRP